MIKKHLGPEPFKRYVIEVIDDGSLRMSAKHEQIPAASANTIKKEVNGHEYK